MKIRININKDIIWQKNESLTKTSNEHIVNLATFTCKYPNLLPENAKFDLNIWLSSDDVSQKYNAQFRQQDKPTNVLSFWQEDWRFDPPAIPANQYTVLGDILLAYETIVKEAEEQKKSIYDHFSHLLIHGTLHILGFHHDSEEEANIMEPMEVEILKQYNIDDPYDDKEEVA